MAMHSAAFGIGYHPLLKERQGTMAAFSQISECIYPIVKDLQSPFPIFLLDRWSTFRYQEEIKRM